MDNAVMFSSEKKDYGTPSEIYRALEAEFGFTLDVCANEWNAKCDRYIDEEIDSFTQSWAGEKCFMNPPYGDPEYPCKPNCKKKKCRDRGYHIDTYIPGAKDWVKKAYDESRKGALVVCLLAARTDTIWFHRYCEPLLTKGLVRFHKGRITFEGAKDPAPFPSMFVIFKPRRGRVARKETVQCKNKRIPEQKKETV